MSFNIINNIKDYVCSEIKLEIAFHELNTNKNKSNYFIIDANSGFDAFGHFVYEGLVYIDIYLELKKTIPDLKIYLKSVKQFKILLLRYFGLNDNDISYNLENNNACYFPRNLGARNTKEHYSQIDILISKFRPDSNPEKSIPILMLPRQKKENFIGNNRVYYTDELEKIILSIDSRNKILNTDNIKDLNEQVEMIRKSSIIIVTDGSPALVNSMFAYNSHFIILGDDVTRVQCKDIEENKPNFWKHIINTNKSHNLSLTSIPEHKQHTLHFDINLVINTIVDLFKVYT